jgi:hypothetical protein
MGIRAEIEVSRHGLFACFVSAAREKGVQRAMTSLSTDEALAAGFQAILDQCRAPWWNPDLLWAKAWCCPANGLEHGAPAAAPATLGQAA